MTKCRAGFATDRGTSNITEWLAGVGALVEDLFGPSEGRRGPDPAQQTAYKATVCETVNLPPFLIQNNLIW